MYSILHDLPIDVPPARVFQAVSRPEDLNNWWPKTSSGEARLGATYNFYFNEEDNWYGEVSEIIPDERFVIRMTETQEDWVPTSFGFELEATENGTLVHFFHQDWQSTNWHYKRTSYCWAILLRGLKDYLEKGIILPFEERE